METEEETDSTASMSLDGSSLNDPLHSPGLSSDSDNSARSLTALQKDGQRASERTPRRHLLEKALELGFFSRDSAQVYYRDKYRELFNETISSIDSCIDAEHDEDLPESQFGLTVWTAAEKSTFFNALARHGRTDLSAVVSSLPSKSEQEILDYIKILEQGSLELFFDQSRYSRPDLKEISAACEISSDCTTSLNVAARALGRYQYDHELAQEISQYGDYGVLRSDHVLKDIIKYSTQAELEKEPDEGEEAKLPDGQLLSATSVPEPLHAALDLFRVAKLLQLSMQIFMNDGHDPSMNWRTYSTPSADQAAKEPDTSIVQELPAIFASALIDFHTLVKHAMRRIISATLFHAHSRIRATGNPGNTRPTDFSVRARDVNSALDALNWRWRPFDSWIGLPRRMHLRIIDDEDSELSYDEVESRLRSRSDAPPTTTPPLSQENLASHTAAQAEAQRSTQSPRPSSSPSSDDSDSSSSLSSLEDSAPDPRDNEAREIRRAAQEDAFLDAWDWRHAAREEKALWQVLRKRVRSSSDGDDDASDGPDAGTDESRLPRRPHAKRRHAHPTDWRAAVEPMEAWEDVGRVLRDADFEARRLGYKRRGVARRVVVEGDTSADEITSDGEAPALGSKTDTVQKVDEIESSADERVRVDKGKGKEKQVQRKCSIKATKVPIEQAQSRKKALPPPSSSSSSDEVEDAEPGPSKSLAAQRPRRQSLGERPVYSFGRAGVAEGMTDPRDLMEESSGDEYLPD